ncbi:unnamed protein product [Onchocerca flexuosa]|uniref:Transcriptional regulator n=1 Tax=Onchocerca flexuosa TaxID=387005 RepID=A0A183I888_9BILA|nr:unnamed protein product [Onchocerca flexuosa]
MDKIVDQLTEMDEAKPSTSYEGFDNNVSPDTKDLVKRLFDAVDIVQVRKFADIEHSRI